MGQHKNDHALLVPVPPGPPGAIRLISFDYTSLLVETRLSPFGYLAITSVTFVATGPGITIQFNAKMNLQAGELVEADIQELMPNTSYSIYAYTTNSAGKSRNSETATFSTGKAKLTWYNY